MKRRLGIVVAAAVAMAPARAAWATPACSLTALGDPCDPLGDGTRSDLGLRLDDGLRFGLRGSAHLRAPWLDDGAAPVWMAPDVAAVDAHPHRWGSLAGLGGIYAGFATWMYFAWYYDKPRLTGFEIGGDGGFGENTYAGGADKLGHAWANAALTRGGAELLRWGGWRPSHAALISAGLSWSLFLFVEIKDGFYYEFSPGDLLANTTGAVLGAAMTHWPRLDRLIDFRVAYWPSVEYRSILSGDFHGSDRVNSVNIAEDYSGQTYFLALHLGAVPRPAATPRWLGGALDYVDVGVGFHATKYKPDPPEEPPYVRRQQLFLGATVDLQRVLDRALGGRRGRAARVTRAIGHGLLEFMSPPSSLLPLVSTSRSPDR